jgi:tetratricopeptide (TPR) repeat protein
MQQADAMEALLRVETGSTAADLGRRLAALREELGEESAAERALELASSACPEDDELRELIVSRYAERKEFGRVASLLAKAVAAQPGKRSLTERLVEAQRLAGKTEEALGTLQTLVEQHPDDIELLRRRGQLLSDLGRDDEALVDYERVVTLDPSLSGELAEALRRSIARSGEEIVARSTLRLVQVLEASGDVGEARETLSRFLDGHPDDLNGWRRLAMFDAQTDKAEDAIATYERLIGLESGPELISAALRYSELCETVGRGGEARGALE